MTAAMTAFSSQSEPMLGSAAGVRMRMRQAATPARKPAKRERAGDDPVGAHAHQPGGIEVFRRAAHADAEQRALEHHRGDAPAWRR